MCFVGVVVLCWFFLFRFFEGLVVVVLVGGVGCSFRCFRWGSLAESSWKVRPAWVAVSVRALQAKARIKGNRAQDGS